MFSSCRSASVAPLSLRPVGSRAPKPAPATASRGKRGTAHVDSDGHGARRVVCRVALRGRRPHRGDGRGRAGPRGGTPGGGRGGTTGTPPPAGVPPSLAPTPLPSGPSGGATPGSPG